MKTKISAYQFFSAFVLVPYGSAVLFYMAAEAKQDAWLAILMYILPAILLQITYTHLWRKYPEDSIVTYMPKIFGRVIGFILSVLYIIYFTYIAARVLRTFSELITITIMPDMPLIIIVLVFMSSIIYAAFIGIENLYRATHLLLPLLTIFFIFGWIFLITTPDGLKLSNLEPVLENGLIFAIKKGWSLIGFPYGESILFTMFYASVVESTKVRKATILATIFLAIYLSLHNIMFISALGTDYVSTALFPLYDVQRLIHVGRAFGRLDIVIVIMMIIGGVVKVSFFMYGAMLGTSQLLKLKEIKYLTVPFSIIIFTASMLLATNYPQHIKTGADLTIRYFHLPFAVIIPLIALSVNYLRNGIKMHR